MEWIVKLAVIWLSLDILIIATAWYASTVIRPYFSNWWRQVVIDNEPTFKDLNGSSVRRPAKYYKIKNRAYKDNTS